MDTAGSREDPERADEPLKPQPQGRDGGDGEEGTSDSVLNPSAPENRPIPGENPGDDVLPISPGRRRLGMYLGLLFILIILIFLVWFAATHTEQSEPGSLFGETSPVPPLPAVALGR